MPTSMVAGNWKMNTTLAQAVELAAGVRDGAGSLAGVDIVLCPPHISLQAVAEAVRGSAVKVGAQNMHFETTGAFTGEISSAMLKEVGCTYVILGHSERRHLFGEAETMINKKVHAAISGGLLPILCVGELLGQREAGETEAVIERQLQEGLSQVGVEKMAAVTIAYEPCWAIGTGKTAAPQQAQEVHAFIRKTLEGLYGRSLAQESRIQYGGSANPGNAAELLEQPDVDGLLVGGASLKGKDFLAIVDAAG
ncbi:MAG: triose-phosphate isomerase [Planctomycetes bacterium]|nr:triose-phosphate isomerase [Planctomycetota bacterium]